MLLLLVCETLKTNAHVMCDQRGGKKKVNRSLASIPFARKKKEGNFFLRENFSFFSSSIFFREREKRNMTMMMMCANSASTTGHGAHIRSTNTIHEREETVSEAKLFHFFRRVQ